MLTAIDLFSGCGGLSLGFAEAGYDILMAIDKDPAACETYKHNLKSVPHVLLIDLFDHAPEEILQTTGVDKNAISVVIGGPPCQGFSVAGKRDEGDVRNTLVGVFLNWVERISPRAFLLENVPGIATMYEGKIGKAILEHTAELGYTPDVKILNAAEYGVPQFRRRAIFIGVKGTHPKFPEPTHKSNSNRDFLDSQKLATPTVSEVITDLPRLRAGESYPDIPNHESRKHGPLQVHKMSYIKPGQNWKSLPAAYRGEKDYPSHGYHRLIPDRPSRILPANASSTSILHPWDDRQITVREFARLQSFPDWFVFQGPKATRYRQVGDAVPPLLARRLGEALREVVEGIPLATRESQGAPEAEKLGLSASV